MVTTKNTSKDIIDKWFSPERTITLSGMKGIGKTNAAVLLMQKLTNIPIDIYTNIKFFKETEIDDAKSKKFLKEIRYLSVPKEIHTVSKLSELLVGLVSDKRKAIIIDEMALISPSTRATSTDVLMLQQLAYVSRHFHAAMMFIQQTVSSITPTFRYRIIDLQLDVIRTPTNKRGFRRNDRWIQGSTRREVINEDTGEKEIRFVHEKNGDIGPLPLARFPGDLLFPASLKIDVNVKGLLDELNTLNSSLEVMGKKGLEIVNKYIDTGLPKKENKAKKIRELKANGLTVPKIVERTGYTKEYIHSIFYKNGKKNRLHTILYLKYAWCVLNIPLMDIMQLKRIL